MSDSNPPPSHSFDRLCPSYRSSAVTALGRIFANSNNEVLRIATAAVVTSWRIVTPPRRANAAGQHDRVDVQEAVHVGSRLTTLCRRGCRRTRLNV